MSYSSNISISARHASDLCVVMRLAPSLYGMAPSSNLISYSTRNYNQYPPYVLKKRSAFQFKTALNDSKSPSPILPLKCSIFGKTGLSDSSSNVQMTRGNPEVSSYSTGRHPFRISLKTFYSKISNH